MKVEPRRLFAPTVISGLVVGGVAYFAASRVWATAEVHASGLPADLIAVTGSDAQPLAGAMALVVGAASVALLATRGTFRRAVGCLMTVAGFVGAALAIGHGGAVNDAVTAMVIESPAFTGDNAPGSITTTVWPALTGILLVLAGLIGAVSVGFSPRWPAMGRKYDAPSSGSTVSDQTVSDDDEAALWKALDEGRDPTQ